MDKRMIGGSIAYFVLAKFGMALFALQPSNLTLLWLPSGIGLLMCMAAGGRALPFIFLASFFANFHGMALPSLVMQLVHTMVAAFVDTLAAWLASFMMRRYLPNGLSKPIDLIPFALYVCVIPTLLTATLLASNLAVGGYISWEKSSDFIIMLLAADSLGILLVFPLLETWRTRNQISSAESLSWLLLTAGMLGVVHLAFTWIPALIFLLIPAFLYMIFSKRVIGEQLSLALVVSLTLAEASRNLGPFELADVESGRLMLVFFLFSTALTVIGMRLQQRQLFTEQALIHERNAQLAWAKEEAEAANVAKSDFLAKMSHEMLTPLHQIDGLAKLLRRDPLTAKQVDRMHKLESSVLRLSGLVESILELSKIETNKLEFEERPIAIDELLENVIAGLQEKAETKGLQIRRETGALPSRLFGDPKHIRVALFHYLDNAVKFTESGSVVVRVRSVEENALSALVRFEVEDTGMGIAPNVLPRLFSMFEQADNSSTRRFGGAGIGLAVTKKIAKLMGGEAGCESRQGQGSLFWFSIRLKKSLVVNSP